jgi:hypothetical protein
MVEANGAAGGLRLRHGGALALSLLMAAVPVAGAKAQVACPLPAADKADLFKNPFNKNSAHHRPIGTDAIYASDTDPGTRDWLATTHLNVNVGNPSGTSVVEVTNRDPFFVIAGAAKCDNVVGMPVTVRLPAGGFLNNAVRPDGGCADNVVIVFDKGAPNSTTDDQVHQLRQFDWNNGRPVAQKRGTWNIRGLGHGTRYGERVGSAASGVAGLFGVLRGHEINTPGYKITHALHLGLPRKEGPGCKVMLSKEVVLPATFRDKSYNSAGNNTGNIPYGALMALKQDIDIATLGLSEIGLRLAEGLQEYGAYVVNGGGCNAGAIDADQHVSYATKRQLRSDIRKIYPLMRRVMNNDVLGSPVAGGGTPLGPNCAFDAG